MNPDERTQTGARRRRPEYPSESQIRARIACICATPSVRLAGPGWRISVDLISWIRLSRTAATLLQPGRARIVASRTRLPHQDAKIDFGIPAHHFRRDRRSGPAPGSPWQAPEKRGRPRDCHEFFDPPDA